MYELYFFTNIKYPNNIGGIYRGDVIPPFKNSNDFILQKIPISMENFNLVILARNH